MKKQLKNSYESVSMSETTSASMRERLSAYADMHEMPAVSQSTGSTSNFFVMPSLFQRAGAFALLAFFVLGTGVTYASHSALPGDPLYAVKLSVAEPLESFTYQKPEEKAVWRNVLVSRRLGEARVLVEMDRLDEKRETEIALQVSLALDSSEQAIARVEAEGNIEVADTLRTSLKSQLRSFSGDDETERADAQNEPEERKGHALTLKALVMDRVLALEQKSRADEKADEPVEDDTHEYASEPSDMGDDVHATTLINPEDSTATTTDESQTDENNVTPDSEDGDESSILPLPKLPTLGL